MKILEAAAWFGIILATLAAFFVTYYFKTTGPITALTWLVWFVLSLGLGLCTAEGKRGFIFAKEANVELHKVVWPGRQETIQTTSIVMVMVGLTGFVLWGVDTGMTWVIGKITQLG